MRRFELSDQEFALLEPLLPPARSGKRGRPFGSHRAALNGILWVLRTGAPWRDLPEHYGPWSSVYDRYRRWRDNGLIARLLDALRASGRAAGLADADFAAIDGTIVRAHKSAAGAQKKGPRPKKAAISKRSESRAAASRRRST